ncbi:MAG TPA: hypothetical protein VIE64_00430 [Solirubrobacterales bacterium]|jgi:hypothetical protein
MGPLTNIWRAGAGVRPRARLTAIAALLALVLALASPLLAFASFKGEIENLPGDASPKQACAIFLKHDKIKPAQEKECRKLIAEGFEEAKQGSGSGENTIAVTTICALQVYAKKITPKQMGECSKGLAGAISDATGGGGGLFDKIGGVVDDVTGAAAGFVGGVIGGALVSGFKEIIEFLFGGMQAAMTVALIRWVITIPNLSGGHVGDLEGRIAIGAGGLLAATTTISIVRFWSSGLTGDGGWAGAEGIMRAAVAAALIGLWPHIFDLAVRLSNALQTGIMSDATEHQLKSLFLNIGKVGIVSGAVPLFLGIVTAVVGTLMLLALVAMKILITAMTIVLFCATPLALVLWPIPELAGAARYCFRTLGVLLAIPVIWCVIFGVFAAIGADTFTFHNTGKDEGIFGTLLNVAVVKPLVAIALLYLALVTPRRLLSLASLPGGGGGVVRSAATHAAVHAGFQYAPEKARSALGRFQSKGGSSGAPAGAAASWAKVGPPAGRGDSLGLSPTQWAHLGKASATPLGKKAASGNQSKTSPTTKATSNPNGSGSAGAGSGATKQPYSAMSDQQHKKAMKRAGGEFNGPEMTQKMSPQQANELGKLRSKYGTESKSGKGVSDAEVGGAAAAFQNRSDLNDCARRAALHKNAKEGTDVLTEWSETDNEHVSDEHRSAFQTLARAHPSQRKGAFAQLDAKGGGESGSNGNSGASGRVVPKLEPSSSGGSARSRVPHNQPAPWVGL